MTHCREQCFFLNKQNSILWIDRCCPKRAVLCLNWQLNIKAIGLFFKLVIKCNPLYMKFWNTINLLKAKVIIKICHVLLITFHYFSVLSRWHGIFVEILFNNVFHELFPDCMSRTSLCCLEISHPGREYHGN